MTTDHPLSPQEFEEIYAKVPRLTVEIIVKSDNGIYLTKRAIEPCKGQWHLPGGTVRFGEPLTEAVKRIAQRELGITVTKVQDAGYIEYPSHYQHDLDSPVGMVFEVQSYHGNLSPNPEAKEGGWFAALPMDMHADQDDFLLKHGYLVAK